MKRIAMICPPAMGHVYPSVALASKLRERGHEVVFFQVAENGKNVERIEHAGFECCLYGTKDLQRQLVDAYAELGRQQGIRALRTMIKIVHKRVQETIYQLPTIFTEKQIDCALIDRLMPGAAAVARGLRLPFASVSNALVLNQDSVVPPCFTTWKPTQSWNKFRNRLAYRFYSLTTRSILRVVNDFRNQNSLSAVESLDENVHGVLQLSQQPEFFTFPRTTPIPGMHFCGPFVDSATRASIEFPWDRLTGRPLIYMSLGTLQNRTDSIYRTVAEACSTLDVDLAISTGGVDHQFAAELPGHPVVSQFAPQLELLLKSSLFITHAGLNSTLESLSAGVPMVAIPIANDQPGVAARIEHHGFGRIVTRRSLGVTKVRSAIQEVLGNHTICDKLDRAQKQLQEMNGCARSADLIEEFLCREAILNGPISVEAADCVNVK